MRYEKTGKRDGQGIAAHKAYGRYGQYTNADEAGHGDDADSDRVSNGEKAKRHGTDADDIETDVRVAVLGREVYKRARDNNAGRAAFVSPFRTC